MLGLAQKISGAHLSVHGLIGNDQCFGGTGKKIDPTAAKQLALGFGDERIAWAASRP